MFCLTDVRLLSVLGIALLTRVPYVVHSIAQLLYLASAWGLVVRFIWILAHSGIRGNEVADGISSIFSCSFTWGLVD